MAQAIDEILDELSTALQQEGQKGGKAGAAAAPKVTSIGLPRGEFLPFVMGTGPIAGGYLKGQVSRVGSGYGYASLSLRSLRAIARSSPLISAIHSVRVNQVLHVARPIMDPKRDVGWAILHKDHFNPRVTVDPEEEYRVADAIRPMFERPHPVYERSLAGAFSKLVNDHLAMNRPVIQVIRNFRGEPVQWLVRDGEEILPTFALARKYVDPGDRRPDEDRLRSAFAKLEGELGYDISEYEYVMARDGRLVDVFRAGELLIPTFAPTSETRDFGYPPSHVERAVDSLLAFATSFNYTSSCFTRGSMVDVILNLSGGYTDDARLALEDQLRARFTGTEGAHRVPVIQTEEKTDLQVIKLKEGNKQMEFPSWMQALISLACAVYRMDPSEINFKGMAGEGSAIFEHSRETEITTAKDQGLNTLLGWLSEALTELVREKNPDYVFYFWGLNREDEQRSLDIRSKELSTTKSIDEIRKADGEKPFGKWWSKVPANPTIFSYIAQEMGAQPSAGGPQAGPEEARGDGGAGRPPRAEGSGGADRKEPARNGDQGDDAGNREKPERKKPDRDDRPVKKAQDPGEIIVLFEDEP